MIKFEKFWDKLIEDDLWWDRIKYQFSRKDLKAVGNAVYDFFLTQPNRLDERFVGEWRNVFRKNCTWAKDIPYVVTQQVTIDKESRPQEPVLTGDERDAKIKEWLQEVSKMPAMPSSIKHISYKEIADEGDWLPKKQAPYPSCSESEVKKRLIHLEYVRQNYDPRTKDPLKDWMSEEDWTAQLTDADVLEIVKANIKL